MSHLADKLFQERETQKENYIPLLKTLFGTDREYDPAVNENTALRDAVEDALYELDMDSPIGALQRYFVEEYYLHGKSKEEIGKAIAENMDLLLADMDSYIHRFLRHPSRGKAIAKSVQDK